jgi:hypothetical protein
LCYGWDLERPHEGNRLVPVPWETGWSFVMLRLSFHFLKCWSFRVFMAGPCFLPWLCTEITQSLIDELDSRFPSHEVLDAFGILYPQYWVQEGTEDSFPHHHAVLKKQYSHRQTTIGKDGDFTFVARPTFSSPKTWTTSKSCLKQR